MFKQKKEFKTTVGGKELTLEVSHLAEQANAAVLAKYGETVVLVTVVMSKHDVTLDYMPLKVDYEERFYAAGKIIGSRFIRRESRPSEDAILSGRLVDRTIRPLFDNRIRREIQVVATVLAIDGENDPDFVGLIGASLALGISDVPWAGPVSGIRIAKVDGKLVVNPNNSEVNSLGTTFSTFVSGTEEKINMIELAGREIQEAEAEEAFALAQKEITNLVKWQKEIIKEVGRPKSEVQLAEISKELREGVENFLATRLEGAIYHPTKAEYQEQMSALRKELFAYVVEKFSESGAPNMKAVEFLFDEAIDKMVHENILAKNKRPDGRALDEVRELSGEVRLFHRTHGSAVFQRGNTQALAVTTLAPPDAEQLIETMETTGKRRFMLHYNFPPYSVGEIGSFRGPGRREIGHGALAEKALLPLIPSKDEFPYTIRVVSEILSSNGSSSMATVCAASLSLMDAGVPLKKPAAGIAMGLMSNDKGEYKVLTDIQGPEDHHGDMDLKVAGTKDGITAIQMDVKVEGFSVKVLREAIEQAKAARIHILSFIVSVMDAPRKELSKYAPHIAQITINPDKIGLVIGPGGKTINGMIKKFELVGIDIEEDGRVFISANSPEKVENALREVSALTKEYKVGEIVEGSVIKLLDFGAIVDLGGGNDGMIHVSELKNGYVKTVSEVVKVGDFVRAKIIRVDGDGHIGLSLKQMGEGE